MKRDRFGFKSMTRGLGDVACNVSTREWMGVIALGITLTFLLPLIGTMHMVHWIGAALFTPSPALNEIRKKVGSTVFGKNHYGQMIMARVKGRNPRSKAQLSVRGEMSFLSKLFNTREVNHKAFNAFGSQKVMKNGLGQPIYWTGQNWFVSLNSIIDYLGGTRLMNEVPNEVIFDSLIEPRCMFSTNPFQLVLNLEIPKPSEDIFYMISVSKPQSLGVSNCTHHKLMTAAPSTGVYLTSKAAQMINSTTGFIVGGNGMIKKTMDGGNSYFNQFSGVTETLNAVSFTDVNNGIVVGNFGTILVTSNGGNTWKSIDMSIYNHLYGVAYKSASVAMICGENGLIMMSTDGGQTWAAQTSGISRDLYSIAINPAMATNAIAAGAGGNILYTMNGGSEWNNVVVGTNDLMSVAIDPTGASAYAAGLEGTILYSGDEGESWTEQTSAAGTAALASVTATAAKTAYICGEAGTILKTTNAGNTWIQETVPTELANAVLNSISFGTGNVGIIAGEGEITGSTSSVYIMTNNGGTKWMMPPRSFGYIYDYDITSLYKELYGVPNEDKQVFIIVEQASKSTGFTNKPGNKLTAS